MAEPQSAPELFPLCMRQVSLGTGARGVVRGMDLNLDGSSRTLLLGPNGAGKSTTLKLLYGLIKPDSGTVTWGAGARPARARAIVLQRPVLLRTSALRNVIYALDLGGVPRRERRERAMAALECVGVSHLANRPARLLSGGERQCIALARAWALRPRVLFLDEPTSGLDPATGRAVERIIGEIALGGTKLIPYTAGRRLAVRGTHLPSFPVACRIQSGRG